MSTDLRASLAKDCEPSLAEARQWVMDHAGTIFKSGGVYRMSETDMLQLVRVVHRIGFVAGFKHGGDYTMESMKRQVAELSPREAVA